MVWVVNIYQIAIVMLRLPFSATGMIAVCRMLGQTTGALMAALILSLLGTGSSLAFIGAAGLALAGTLASASRVASENGTPRIPR